MGVLGGAKAGRPAGLSGAWEPCSSDTISSAFQTQMWRYG